jgi:hypothetical protein
VAFGPLDRADEHDHAFGSGQAKVGAHRCRIAVQGEFRQVDRVVDDGDVGGVRKAPPHGARDRHHPPRVALGVSDMPATQQRIRPEHFAHDPHHRHTLAPRGRGPGEQHARVEVQHIWSPLAQDTARRLYGRREGAHEARHAARLEARVGRVVQGATGRHHLGGNAQFARVVEHRAVLGEQRARLELLAVQAGQQLEQRHGRTPDTAALVHREQ